MLRHLLTPLCALHLALAPMVVRGSEGVFRHAACVATLTAVDVASAGMSLYYCGRDQTLSACTAAAAEALPVGLDRGAKVLLKHGNGPTETLTEATLKVTPDGKRTVEVVPYWILDPYEGPVVIGQTTTYADSVSRSVVGDGLIGDHQPSRAAMQSRIESEIGRELTPTEARHLRDSTGCVIVSGGGHCALSNTYGGRNNPERILSDSADLRASADRDFTAIIPDLQASGMTEAQIDAARTRLHYLNGTVINDLNTQFDTQIRY